MSAHDELAGLAEKLALVLGIEVADAVRAVVHAMENLPEADALLVEQAAAARLQSAR